MALTGLTSLIVLTGFLSTWKPPTTSAESTPRHDCRIICHPENPKVHSAAKTTLDAAWASAEKMLGEVPASIGDPAELHLYESVEEYEKKEAELTHGRFKSNRAFTHRDSKSAHVVIVPPSSREALKKIGLPAMTRHVISHEAFHLVGYSLTPKYDDVPDWITDGAASFVECEVLSKNNWIAGPERDPYLSTYTSIATQLLKEGKLPKINDIMHSKLDALPPTARYGLRWLLFRFLEVGPRPGSGRKLIRKMMHVLRESTDSSESQPSEDFEKLEKEYIGLDDEFPKFIRGLKPQWDEDFRSLDTSGKQWRQIAFPEKNAVAWRVAPVGKDQYEISGHVRILPGTKQQMNLLLGRSDEGFVSVAFVAGYGVTVFRYRKGPDEWENLATAKVTSVEVNKNISFRLVISDGEVRVSVGKKPVLTATVGEFSMRGPWGLGAQAGSTGTWTKIRCTPLAKPKGQ